MATDVERTHWYRQLPVSWGVEAVLVMALLIGTVVAVTQVRGRDDTIAAQATTIRRLTTTSQQAQAQVQTLHAFAEIDRAIVTAYATLQAERLMLDLAQGRLGIDRDEVADGAMARVLELEQRVATLKAQRRALETLLSSSTGVNT